MIQKGGAAVYLVLVAALLAQALTLSEGLSASTADLKEVEQFVRARIEIGEFMADFMKRQGGMERFRPGPKRRSMEEMHRMTEEINSAVDGVLEKHGLAVDEFQDRGPAIFGDRERLDALFSIRPELRSRYEALPEQPMGFMGGGPPR